MPKEQKKKIESHPLQVKLPDALEAGVFANASSATIGLNEVILDFGFLVPNQNSVKVVSRVLMTQNSLIDLVKMLNNILAKKSKQPDQK